MSSNQDNSAVSAKDPAQNPPHVSTPTSATDTRHPLARFESAGSQDVGLGLSESFQSTDTIRHRPESLSYGT